MTTNNNRALEEVSNMTLDEISDLANEAREALNHIRKSRDEQPARLAKARADADEARGWAIIEEPWESQVTAIPAYNSDGERTGTALTVPNIAAKELFAARLAFDMLDAGDDCDQLEEVKTRYFTMLGGDTGSLFLVCMAALDTIASLVVPQLLEEIEQRGSNWTERVRLCEARAKAWQGRADKLNGLQDQAAEAGINPVDAYDIGAAAIDGLAMDPVDLDSEGDDEG
ncbi:hypothetical protein [Mycolicibacterium obuense]|uniref:Uncharacterized protein n=1 Tax=Mycolicibacterium obuense TaxID=1807 RepID=A0A0M2K4S9_9MYCO|nr:hypothetical protein [Mycolicibacterium obuense]KKF01933.1 hypothetical protein WN67_10990 [Mycolicibacterium obuense]